ncbi:MAG: hypothetical protein NZ556_06035 [Fimbriimonadales bacterium]|nr:hypothetical protein [Fimbriimonadales bacterium]
MPCSVGVSPKQSVAWTVLSKPECTDKTVRATCTGWKPVLQMHGQDCPCYLHGLKARATEHGQDCPCYLHGLKARATEHGQDCPCYAGASARRQGYENPLAFLNSL